MVDSRVKLLRTNHDVLVSNLRGEVGEAITTWILLRHFISVANTKQTGDLTVDIRDRDLAFLNLLRSKLIDDLTAKLSELADPKIGRTNFYFTAKKLHVLEFEVQYFADFVVRNKFREKRNREIAHREQSEVWPDRGPIQIHYRSLVKGTAMAVRLMKRFDQIVIGPTARVQWQRMRQRRYQLTVPPRAMYMLLPYLMGSRDDSFFAKAPDKVPE